MDQDRVCQLTRGGRSANCRLRACTFGTWRGRSTDIHVPSPRPRTLVAFAVVVIHAAFVLALVVHLVGYNE